MWKTSPSLGFEYQNVQPVCTGVDPFSIFSGYVLCFTGQGDMLVELILLQVVVNAWPSSESTDQAFYDHSIYFRLGFLRKKKLQ